ncbi:hypothetical protein ACTFIT_010747 [Dictyostelium discoideum]
MAAGINMAEINMAAEINMVILGIEI